MSIIRDDMENPGLYGKYCVIFVIDNRTTFREYGVIFIIELPDNLPETFRKLPDLRRFSTLLTCTTYAANLRTTYGQFVATYTTLLTAPISLSVLPRQWPSLRRVLLCTTGGCKTDPGRPLGHKCHVSFRDASGNLPGILLAEFGKLRSPISETSKRQKRLP